MPSIVQVPREEIPNPTSEKGYFRPYIDFHQRLSKTKTKGCLWKQLLRKYKESE